ncbi:MAG: gamma-glutamyltransferase [Wenzhouxiangellaceae bacterium]|nr:gamma-glutamyltransferase [Wenzhouxiangellaceae bacterium]
MPSRPAQVASGHEETTQAAVEALRAGGNAVDALVAAGWTACVAEPIFCSLGGGGAALLRMRGRAPSMLDFFTQTPRQRRVDDLDFYPIHGNFGTDTQEFHVGMGAVAVPGTAAGFEELHRRHGRVPMRELVAIAADRARRGVHYNATQAFALDILEPIVRATPEASAMFGMASGDAPLPAAGDVLTNPPLADCMEALAEHGSELFYRGEIAVRIAEMSTASAGHLQLADLAGYRVRWRRPTKWSLGSATVWSNPPPAFGGLMVELMTRALEHVLPDGAVFGSEAHLDALTTAMRDSDEDRLELEQPDCLRCDRALMRRFRALGPPGRRVSRGTTHMAVRDGDGNFAGMTLTNGEGCGRVVPGCGFMLNNMLGEEDLNRFGFHRWPTNRRLSSMIAPTLVERDGERVLLGSGGSNRIRTAIAQVLCNLQHFDMGLAEAIDAPRLHLEGGRLAIELGGEGAVDWPDSCAEWLARRFPDARRWPERSLYFGGVNAVSDADAAADPRRDGHAWSGRIA